MAHNFSHSYAHATLANSKILFSARRIIALAACIVALFIVSVVCAVSALIYTPPIDISLANYDDFITMESNTTGVLYSDGRNMNVDYQICNYSTYTLDFELICSITIGDNNTIVDTFVRRFYLSPGDVRSMEFSVLSHELYDENAHSLVDVRLHLLSLDGIAIQNSRRK